MASHSTLQYLLPSIAVQVHGGCSHFLVFGAINPPLLARKRQRVCSNCQVRSRSNWRYPVLLELSLSSRFQSTV